MTVLVAQARVQLPDPQSVIAQLAEHLAEHGAAISRVGSETIVSLGSRRGVLTVIEGGLSARVEAPDATSLHEVKEAIGAHVIEYAGGAVREIDWQGDRSVATLPPNYRELTVCGIVDLTPHMRRISFSGADLAHFDSIETLHVRLFLPPGGEAGGLAALPEGTQPAVRKYTIREIDAAAGRVAIDFVMHEDAGPGAAFAAKAGMGDRIGMAGPGGRGLRKADWYLFLGDETALPAIGRMLASLPAEARGLACIEIADTAERQDLVHPAGVALEWLCRDGAEPGSTDLLPRAFEAVAWPEEDAAIFLWAAMEYEGFKKVRAAARLRLRPGTDDHLIVSYWRRGASEEQHASQKAAERAA